MQEKISIKTYPVTLKIDCRKMTEPEKNSLERKILFAIDNSGYIKLKTIDDDILYLTGELMANDYNKVWDILDGYDVILD